MVHLLYRNCPLAVTNLVGDKARMPRDDEIEMDVSLPPKLAALVEESARRAGRPVEAEIAKRLENGLNANAAIEAAVEKIIARIEELLIARITATVSSRKLRIGL